MTGQRLVNLVVIVSPNKSAPGLITSAGIDQDYSDARVNRYDFTAVCRSPDRRRERVGQASSDPLLGQVMHIAAENRGCDRGRGVFAAALPAHSRPPPRGG